MDNSSKRRLLAIGLDGFEISLAERLMAQGRMPNMARLKRESARFALNHGPAKYSGLAWEHVSTGRSPDRLDRHSAVTFDPQAYHIRQDPTAEPPIFARLESRCVLFDVPYCDLHVAPSVRGIARWGAHDPGVPQGARPAELFDEITRRFGEYPATEHIYAMVWQSPEMTRTAGEALARATRVRARAASWLLAERLPDWDLAVVTVSEPHSAIEPLWHGVDADHPLHAHDSAPVARRMLEAVYTETDSLIGHLRHAVPDADLCLFAMHGMGPNDADTPAMVMLPELLYRRQFGKPYMRDMSWPQALPDGTPLLAPDQTWHHTMLDRIPPLWSDPVQAILKARTGYDEAPVRDEKIDWQPASRYRPFWPQMEAFALPSFYDGRIRLNVLGRERYGTVSPNRYAALLDDIVEMLDACVDPLTGEKNVAGVLRPDKPPMNVGRTEADLYVYWRGLARALEHPELGRIGPVPFRRTGGHSGQSGFLYLNAPGYAAGDRGEASSFDVVPTILSLLGETSALQGVSGQELAKYAATARAV